MTTYSGSSQSKPAGQRRDPVALWLKLWLTFWFCCSGGTRGWSHSMIWSITALLRLFVLSDWALLAPFCSYVLVELESQKERAEKCGTISAICLTASSDVWFASAMWSWRPGMSARSSLKTLNSCLALIPQQTSEKHYFRKKYEHKLAVIACTLDLTSSNAFPIFLTTPTISDPFIYQTITFTLYLLRLLLSTPFSTPLLCHCSDSWAPTLNSYSYIDHYS